MNLIVTQRMAALAALLALALMPACGLRSTNSSTETLTVYQDAPNMKLLDLGEPGNSPGDVYHFFAPLHSSPGGPVIGEVFGSKTLVKLATDANPNLERRATLLSLPSVIVRIKLSLWALPITRRRPGNLMQTSRAHVRY